MDFSFTEEQLALREQLLRFGRERLAPRAARADREEYFDREAWRMLGQMGVLGLPIAPEYGGSGADVVTCVAAGEALGEAGVDGGLLLSWGAHTFLCSDTIQRNGTDEQKRKYLPYLASGEWIGCMGVTEPGAGSDAASLSTRAEKTSDGWKLNGSKIFITNGPVADVAVIYATLDKKLGHAGITAFIVEKGTPGFSAGEPLHKMGVRGSPTSELFFDDCRLPPEALLGEEGGGFLLALQTVEWDRSTLVAPFVGAMRFLEQRCARYAQERRQFGRPIADFQAVRDKLTNLRLFWEAARGLVYRVAWCKDQGRPLNHLEAAVAKLFIGDASLGPAHDAVTLLGGYGYCREYEVERIFRDSRLAPIGGGTSEIQKLIISRLMLGGGE